MMKNSSTRGFTLIELLVVIAIIGILASVVLASLNSARSKGADAAIKSSINNARAQAELFYDNNSSQYDNDNNGGTAGVGSLCGDTTITNIQASVDDAGGTFVCYADNDQYRMSSVLVSSTTATYCVDSTGVAGNTTAVGATALVCP